MIFIKAIIQIKNIINKIGNMVFVKLQFYLI